MSKLKVLTSDEFPLAIATGSVLVDFGAPWCSPCKAMEPILAQLRDELEGKLFVAKVDVDATPELAAQLGVMSVPALMLFKDGQKLASRTGAQSAKQLLEFVQPAL